MLKLMKIYLAAPLFSDAELTFNLQVCERLEDVFEVYLPQRDGGLVAEMVRNGLSPNVASARVFSMDRDAIRNCDVILAVLDGRAIDEGVALEMGYGFCLDKYIVGLQTDSRRLLPQGNNPMIEQVMQHYCKSLHELWQWAATTHKNGLVWQDDRRLRIS